MSFVLAVCGSLAQGAATGPVQGEGPLGNSAPLPSFRVAEEALAQGDAAWARASAADGRNRVGPRNAAFDAWRNALENSTAGAGVRLQIEGAEGVPATFPDPDGTHGRRAEGVAEAVQRRLASLPDADRAAWLQRFGGLATDRLADLRTGLASGTVAPEDARLSLSRLERGFPLTVAASLACLALFDLSLEEGRPAAAGAWLLRGKRHRLWSAGGQAAAASGGAPTSLERASLERAWERRTQALMAAHQRRTGFDHTDANLTASSGSSSLQEPFAANNASGRPQPDNTSPPPLPTPVTTQRITGLIRGSKEPFGLGLTSGAAFFRDGAVVIQGAHGVLSLSLTEEGDHFALGLTGAQRPQYSELFDVRQPVARAAPSAGGWPSLPATDGERVALVMGRGEPPRSFRDVEIAGVGNYLGLCAQGPASRPLEPMWLVRDGLIALTPAGGGRRRRPRADDSPLPFGGISDAFSRDSQPQPGWNLGSGWEFQPGPILADDRLFVLARGLGGATDEDEANGEDRADELRLLALDALTAELIWSVSVTRERGLLAGSGRGEAGYYAATAMPLALDRSTGTLLVGSNSGLIAAYGAAEGRLLWAVRNQRRSADEGGWPGSQPPRLVRAASGAAASTAWFTPFDSGFAYALPSAPAPLDGRLFREAPRPRGEALALAAALPPAIERSPDRVSGRDPGNGSTLLLLGRYGRHGALLIDEPGEPRRAAAYLAPGDRFAGSSALEPDTLRLWVAGTRELSGFSPQRDFSLESGAPIPSQGSGSGGDVLIYRDFLYVLGRDTVWVYRLPGS